MPLSSRSLSAPAWRGRLLAGLTGALLLLAGCGGAADEPGDDSAPAAGDQPVTVEGAYGPITLDRKPERVISLTMSSVDILDSLGVTPVAYGLDATPGDAPGQVPWLPDLDPALFDSDLITAEYTASAEQLATHQPDLIIGATHLIDETSYAQLSQIAPTFVPQTGADRNWTTTLDEIGVLLGDPDAASQVQADLDADFAAARESLPGLQGKTFNYVQWLDTMVQFHRTNWTLEQIGMVPAPGAHEASGRPLQLSMEEVEQLDADVIVVMASPENEAAMRQDPRTDLLPASRNGALIVGDPVVHYATLGGYAGPQSVRWALPQLVDPLEATELNRAGE